MIPNLVKGLAMKQAMLNIMLYLLNLNYRWNRKRRLNTLLNLLNLKHRWNRKRQLNTRLYLQLKRRR